MKKRILIVISVLILVLTTGSLIYLNDTYPPTNQTLEPNLTLENKENIIIQNNQTHTKAIVLYPGGKVDPLAYQTFMAQFAQEDFLVIIAKMPFNLAVFNPNKIDSIIKDNPQIKDWYVVGHSLGGAMAANHLAKHPDEIKGIYLLASYPTKNLKDYKGKILSIYGSQDGVLNIDTYNKNKNNFPTQTKETILKGGNHAQFGNYGKQKGDNEATITQIQQQTETFNLIIKSINEE